MKNADNARHRRYYIFYHTGSGDNLHYRTGEGGWHEDFEKAELWGNHDFALSKAKVFVAQNKNHESMMNRIVVIGSVDVDIDPFFSLEVINVT